MDKVIIVTVIGIIVTLLIGFNAFNAADIAGVRKGDNVCMTYLQDTFELGFKNIGEKNTVLCLSVSSEDLNFTKSNDCIIVEAKGEVVPYKMSINVSSMLKRGYASNLTINYTYRYSTHSIWGLFWGTVKQTSSCRYVQDANEINPKLIP